MTHLLTRLIYDQSTIIILPSLSELNLLLELQIALDLNDDALEVLCRHCAIQFASDESADKIADLAPEKQLETFKTVVVPAESAPEIRTKLVVVLVNLGASHLVKV